MIETIEITNFQGRLTRIVNGDLNSGFAKYANSYGYNPFAKPGNLTWMRGPIDNTATLAVTGLMMAAKSRFESRDQYVYGIDDAAKLYKIKAYGRGSPPGPTSPTGSVIAAAVTPAGEDYSYGASMEFYGAPQKIYIGNLTDVVKVNFDGSQAASIAANYGQTNSSSGTSQSSRAIKQFVGKLLFANVNTIGAIDPTGLATSSIIGTGNGNLSSQLNPPLPVDMFVQDLDISVDGNYLNIAATTAPGNISLTTAGDDAGSGAIGTSQLFEWNGVDQGATASQQLPAGSLSAFRSYLNQERFFSTDLIGATMGDGVNKLLTLQNTKPPLPNAISPNGNFITWVTPENASDNSTMYNSLFYFGSLDQENPPGLYRLCRQSPTLASGFFYQSPCNIVPAGAFTTIYPDKTAVGAQSYGMHFFSTLELSSGSSQKKFWVFYVTPINTNVTANEGVYETQTQLWSKRVSIGEIRVYLEPAVTGNAFQLDLIGTDGSVITNGTFTYNFGEISDPQSGSTAVERINFSPNMKPQYGLGLRISNTGTKNMTIKKIEVDWTYAGK